MARGSVKWFDPKKGFGFVINEDSADVFVHYTNIEGEGFRCLKNGQIVNYEERAGEKGLFGVHVRILSDEEGVTADDEQKLKFF